MWFMGKGQWKTQSEVHTQQEGFAPMGNYRPMYINMKFVQIFQVISVYVCIIYC